MEGPAIMRRRETLEQQAANNAAYERGWVDSLDARWVSSIDPMIDRYWYARGWHACADYRWRDPSGRGVAPDRDYRIARDPLS